MTTKKPAHSSPSHPENSIWSKMNLPKFHKGWSVTPCLGLYQWKGGGRWAAGAVDPATQRCPQGPRFFLSLLTVQVSSPSYHLFAPVLQRKQPLSDFFPEEYRGIAHKAPEKPPRMPWPWLGHMSTFHPILGKKVGLRLEQLCSRGGVRLSEGPRMQRVAEYSWPSQGPFSNEDRDGRCQISCQQYPPLHSHRGISITLGTSLNMLNMCAGLKWLEFQMKLTQCWMGLPSSKAEFLQRCAGNEKHASSHGHRGQDGIKFVFARWIFLSLSVQRGQHFLDEAVLLLSPFF